MMQWFETQNVVGNEARYDNTAVFVRFKPYTIITRCVRKIGALASADAPTDCGRWRGFWNLISAVTKRKNKNVHYGFSSYSSCAYKQLKKKENIVFQTILHVLYARRNTPGSTACIFFKFKIVEKKKHVMVGTHYSLCSRFRYTR